MDGHRGRSGARPPLPLSIGFAVFVLGLGYMVAASLARRDAPVFAPSSSVRVRPASWTRSGDTLTLDATDGERWRFASLAIGRPLTGADTTRWQLAARRYRITVAGALADLGPVPFASARVGPSTRFISSRPGELANEAIGHWYRYGLTTHLLTPNGHVYALRARDGTMWKLQVVGYYCPGLRPGCLTLHYAPMSEADG
jgi:outer membrane protein assembly factor BamB